MKRAAPPWCPGCFRIFNRQTVYCFSSICAPIAGRLNLSHALPPRRNNSTHRTFALLGLPPTAARSERQPPRFDPECPVTDESVVRDPVNLYRQLRPGAEPLVVKSKSGLHIAVSVDVGDAGRRHTRNEARVDILRQGLRPTQCNGGRGLREEIA